MELPRENEEDNGAGGGAASDEALAAAEASGDGVKDGVAEEEEGEGGEAVHGGGIGGVHAISSVVVLVGNHFSLQRRNHLSVLDLNCRFNSQKRERKEGDGVYGATTSFGADGEDEGDEVESDEDDQNRQRNCHDLNLILDSAAASALFCFCLSLHCLHSSHSSLFTVQLRMLCLC